MRSSATCAHTAFCFTAIAPLEVSRSLLRQRHRHEELKAADDVAASLCRGVPRVNFFARRQTAVATTSNSANWTASDAALDVAASLCRGVPRVNFFARRQSAVATTSNSAIWTASNAALDVAASLCRGVPRVKFLRTATERRGYN